MGPIEVPRVAVPYHQPPPPPPPVILDRSVNTAHSVYVSMQSYFPLWFFYPVDDCNSSLVRSIRSCFDFLLLPRRDLSSVLMQPEGIGLVDFDLQASNLGYRVGVLFLRLLPLLCLYLCAPLIPIQASIALVSISLLSRLAYAKTPVVTIHPELKFLVRDQGLEPVIQMLQENCVQEMLSATEQGVVSTLSEAKDVMRKAMAYMRYGRRLSFITLVRLLMNAPVFQTEREYTASAMRKETPESFNFDTYHKFTGFTYLLREVCLENNSAEESVNTFLEHIKKGYFLCLYRGHFDVFKTASSA